jgi:hypothetical protein
VLAAEGDLAAAESELAAAIDRFERAGHPLDVARCRQRDLTAVGSSTV